MDRTPWVAIGMALLAVVAGCVGVGTHSSTPETTEPTATEKSGGDAPYGIVEFHGGQGQVQNSTLNMTRRVRIEAPENDSLEPTTFEDVVLCLYDDNGSVINSTVVGDFEMPTDYEWVTISASPIPKYVVIDHPRFRTYGHMEVRVYVWNETDRVYNPEWGPLEELDPGFEYPRHNDTGRCM